MKFQSDKQRIRFEAGGCHGCPATHRDSQRYCAKCLERRRIYQKSRRQTVAGRAVVTRYVSSEKAYMTRKRAALTYLNSEKGKATMKRLREKFITSGRNAEWLRERRFKRKVLRDDRLLYQIIREAMPENLSPLLIEDAIQEIALKVIANQIQVADIRTAVPNAVKAARAMLPNDFKNISLDSLENWQVDQMHKRFVSAY